MTDVFRKQYRPLTPEDGEKLNELKSLAEDVHNFLDTLGGSREVSLAKTKLEESVMWASKHITA